MDEQPPAESHTEAPATDMQMADTRTLRAMAHPLRSALLDVIRAHGPLTATQAAAYVDDTPSNCSFHLRTLAAAGLIEQAPSSDGRSRPWQGVRRRWVLEPGTTAQSRSAFSTAVSLMQRRVIDGLLDWTDRRDEAPQEWQEAAFSSLVLLQLTAEELTTIATAINGLLEPYIADEDRRRPDPTGTRLPVRFSLAGYPLLPPVGGTELADDDESDLDETGDSDT